MSLNLVSSLGKKRKKSILERQSVSDVVQVEALARREEAICDHDPRVSDLQVIALFFYKAPTLFWIWDVHEQCISSCGLGWYMLAMKMVCMSLFNCNKGIILKFQLALIKIRSS